MIPRVPARCAIPWLAPFSSTFPEVQLARNAPVHLVHRGRITNVSLHNGRFFGGGMKMAPAADLTDGKP